MRKCTIGIDLGGSNIMAIVTDEEMAILARKKVRTELSPSLAIVAGDMHRAAGEALAKAGRNWNEVDEIGVAVPSAVDPESGRVLHAPNLGWHDEDARGVLEKTFERRVYMENDVNCGLIGEFYHGVARGSRNVVGFFVGTGLGGGIIINGRLHTGIRGCAGELGHVIVRHKGRLCGCGNRGCLEAYCSKVAFGKAIDKQINRCGRVSIMSELTGGDLLRFRSRVLAEAWQRNDAVVRKVVRRGFRMLGVATANIMATLAPDCVVFGGGVIEAMGADVLPVIREGMRSHLFALAPDNVDLRLSALGDDAVPVGAVVMARRKGDI